MTRVKAKPGTSRAESVSSLFRRLLLPPLGFPFAFSYSVGDSSEFLFIRRVLGIKLQ